MGVLNVRRVGMKKIIIISNIILIVFFILLCGCTESYDLEAKGIPKFASHDFTNLDKVTQISRFRSVVGHDFSDETESCRSMKHYYEPFEEFRNNSLIEIYSPVDGFISELNEESFGPLEGDINYQIRIQPKQYPAFTFILFHVDLVSDSITQGKKVTAGELLGYSHLYSPSLEHSAGNFDIAVKVNTPDGQRYISFFETMTDSLFDTYEQRGVSSRSDFIISKEERDANPGSCDGEWFTIKDYEDTLVNWVELHDETSEQSGEGESDPCGNAIGNGHEIVFGQITPNDWNPDNPFRSLTIHPSNENIILIGTEANGFVKSVDGGETWVRYRDGLRHGEGSGEQLYPEVYDICWSESNPDIMYAATTGGPGPLAGSYGGDGGMYKSVDGGETWVRKNCGLDNEWLFSIYVSPNNPDIAVVGISGEVTTGSKGDIEVGTFFDGGIFRTEDGGDSWVRASLHEDDVINGYVTMMSSESVLYTFGQIPKGGEGNIGFYRSFDEGITWESFAPSLKDTYGAYFDVSGDVIYSADSGQVHKSLDGGDTWTDHRTSGWVYAIAISTEDVNRVVYSTSDGLYVTEDGMDSSEKVVDIAGEYHVTDIVFAPTNPSIVYAIGIGYDLYKSTDSGDSFSKLVNLREDVLEEIP